MGRETWRFWRYDKERAERKLLHPKWIVVGCMLPLVFGAAAYLISGWFLEANAERHWVNIPEQLMRPPFAPNVEPGLVVRIGLAIILMLMMYAVLAALFAFFFPIEPGETDVPPLKRRRLRDR